MYAYFSIHPVIQIVAYLDEPVPASVQVCSCPTVSEDWTVTSHFLHSDTVMW